MSIESELLRIEGERNDLRTKLISLGVVSDAEADLETCVTAIEGIDKKTASDVSVGVSIIIPNGYYKGTPFTMIDQGSVSLPKPTVTKNGANITSTYTATTGYNGDTTAKTTTVSAVSLDDKLIASNIKKDVSIFGVTGSYEGSGGSGVSTIQVTFNKTGSNTYNVTYINGSGVATTQSLSGAATVVNAAAGSIIVFSTAPTNVMMAQNATLIRDAVYTLNSSATSAMFIFM